MPGSLPPGNSDLHMSSAEPAEPTVTEGWGLGGPAELGRAGRMPQGIRSADGLPVQDTAPPRGPAPASSMAPSPVPVGRACSPHTGATLTQALSQDRPLHCFLLTNCMTSPPACGQVLGTFTSLMPPNNVIPWPVLGRGTSGPTPGRAQSSFAHIKTAT